jgi:hypothetical protein
MYIVILRLISIYILNKINLSKYQYFYNSIGLCSNSIELGLIYILNFDCIFIEIIALQNIIIEITKNMLKSILRIESIVQIEKYKS